MATLRDLPLLRLGPHAVTPIVLAPMAGVSERPFRELAFERGAGLAPTELSSAKSLLTAKRPDPVLCHDPKKERPFAVQLFGSEPSELARAAELVAAAGAAIVDLNMGCPVRKVTRKSAGSALLREPKRAAEIVSEIRRSVGQNVAVTAKIRAGWDESTINALDVGRALEDAGLDAIALHGRTRSEGYSGVARVELVGSLVSHLKIPVIANGDIDSPARADQVVRTTGCAAVMIGRAALGNPWIFDSLRRVWRGEAPAPEPTPNERADMILRHLRANVEHVGHELTAVRRFRPQLAWYARGLRGRQDFVPRAQSVEELPELFDAIDSYFRVAERELDESASYDERRALG
ncbi:MAG: tRNA dihydrouridine synthase DusB [Deltaproteobacteria bacterium]|nr:tRNA dihydrouridine synthase DusB [Deltaproteobacteria bacterium]